AHQRAAVQAGNRNPRHDPADAQQEHRENDPRLQFRNFETIRECVGDGPKHVGQESRRNSLRAGRFTLPPADSILPRAEALNAWALTTNFFFNSPSPRILTPSVRPFARPRARNAASSTRAPSSNSFNISMLTGM